MIRDLSETLKAVLQDPTFASVFPELAAADIVLTTDTLWDPALHGALLYTICAVLRRTSSARARPSCRASWPLRPGDYRRHLERQP